ncbi:hypothetical protein NTCA1_18700 [Novosphingobium sp. TCA1]|uniref:Uncharacterized protein n=1 Tax=Novosphingobium guangzhouense TaxID=1850347 RepID=A0A2K2FXR0_9SPHN|nr:hypothetical protein A8V01_23480 [Novosphingobium guangzhouense]GFE74221.1 hypothetical protein NTCA1_18700 [Novosphingobium sp. TCA1]
MPLLGRGISQKDVIWAVAPSSERGFERAAYDHMVAERNVGPFENEEGRIAQNRAFSQLGQFLVQGRPHTNQSLFLNINPCLSREKQRPVVAPTFGPVHTQRQR